MRTNWQIKSVKGEIVHYSGTAWNFEVAASTSPVSLFHLSIRGVKNRRGYSRKRNGAIADGHLAFLTAWTRGKEKKKDREREEESRRENYGEADRKRSEHAPAKVCLSYIWLQRVLTLFCHSPALLLSLPLHLLTHSPSFIHSNCEPNKTKQNPSTISH